QVGDPFPAGDADQAAPEDRHHAEGDDDGGDAQIGDDGALRRHHRYAEDERREPADEDRRARDRKRAAHRRQHADQRADRDVDIAGYNDHRHAERCDGDIGVAEQDVGEVAEGEKARIDEADDDGEPDDRHGEQRLLGGETPQRPAARARRANSRRSVHAASSMFGSPPIIAAPTASDVACARSNSATSRPSRMTRTRSLMPSTSGSSLEIIRMATPAPASSLIRRWISALAPTSMPRVGSS